MIDLTKTNEKAIAVAVNKKGGNREKAFEFLEELAFLAETAGATVIDKIYQELEKKNNATVIGKGKVEEIKQIIDDEEVSMVIFDDDLSAKQVRNLEKAFEVKVMDRSGIILDIFASRAKTNEAKTQVELAQLQYMLPRLTRMWTHLSKQFGGIGTKGPGETQIETDRRIVRDRIEHLKGRLDKIDSQNIVKRKNRSAIPKFALVGYTNTGKSTLLKAITGSEPYIKNELFATLDTTTRSFELLNGTKCLLSDTVGFIRKLPTHLIASFRTTLAEVQEADYLLHIVDISHPNFEEQIQVVEETLKSINADNIPRITVFNKIDCLENLEELKYLQEKYTDCCFISAKNNLNIIKLLEILQVEYEKKVNFIQLSLPYSEMQLKGNLFKIADVVSEESTDFGTNYKVKVSEDQVSYFNHLFSKFVTEN